MNEGAKVTLMNVLMALIAALVWLALVRLAGASWLVAVIVYAIAAACIFLALSVVSLVSDNGR